MSVGSTDVSAVAPVAAADRSCPRTWGRQVGVTRECALGRPEARAVG